ncbi:8527_t:CDS:2 [Funneliformis mosseae]|uniref:8527_t:CDS:1 n=1 Tax=Funneliformis mosseae TaxID=27381 RepID=A0A9N8V8W5_FUNMO|nr:8527_t:CDS:2 [Funneliformis mosseae]
MTSLYHHGSIIVANLIILILGLPYAGEALSLHFNNNNYLNWSLLVNNIHDHNKLIYNKVQFQQEDNVELYSTFPFDSRTGYLVVIISSYLALYFNFVGTSYVLYRSYYRRRSNGVSLPMTLRVPMYIAITDLFLILTHVVNISHMAITKTLWKDSYCKIIGGLNNFFQCMNMFLVGGVAVTTFLRVKRGRFFSLGKYDYKLFTGMISLSSLITIIFYKSYGPNNYWCGGEFSDKVLAISSLCIISVVMLVSLYCYISIIREMRSIKIEECFENSNIPEEIAVQRKETNKRIYSKISSYILIFIIQYVPVTIYNIGHIIRVKHYWVYVVCDIGINFGGIGNFIQYTINEGWSDDIRGDTSDSYGLNPTNFRYTYAGGRQSSVNNDNSMNSNFDGVVDSFGIIRPSPQKNR